MAFNNWYDGFPAIKQLVTAEGLIEKVWRTGKRDKVTRLKIQGDKRYYVYFAMSGEYRTFQRHAFKGAPIKLSYDPSESNSPIFDEKAYHTIYSVDFPGNWKRSYYEIKREYSSNSNLGLLFALFFFVIPIFLFLKDKVT